MRLRLYENFRFLLYAPFYAADAIGAYAAEGLEVLILERQRTHKVALDVPFIIDSAP